MVVCVCERVRERESERDKREEEVHTHTQRIHIHTVHTHASAKTHLQRAVLIPRSDLITNDLISSSVNQPLENATIPPFLPKS